MAGRQKRRLGSGEGKCIEGQGPGKLILYLLVIIISPATEWDLLLLLGYIVKVEKETDLLQILK